MSLRPLHTVLGGTTLVLGVLSLGIATFAFTGFTPSSSAPIQGRLLPDNIRADTVPWKVFTPDLIIAGITVPADTNAIIQLPPDRKPILRDVLFGTVNDTTTRYWGYCLPEDYQKENAMTRNVLPGKIFMSEGEQKARAANYAQTLRKNFTIPRDLTE